MTLVVAFEVPSQVLVLGAVTGVTYALLGAGLTLIYRTSRVLNFAHGQIGSLVAALVPFLVLRERVPYGVAVGAAIATAVVLGFVVERTVVRALGERSSPLLVLVATIGLGQLLLVAEGLIPRNDLAGATYPLPFDAAWRVGGFVLGPGHLLILLVGPALVLGLHLLLSRTRLGLASRAVAENREAALLAGLPVNAVSVAVWIAAAVLAGCAGILSGPTRSVITTVAIGPVLMVRGLAAALVGSFERLPLVLGGGVALGVLEALVIWNYPVGGALEVVLFAVVLGTLLLNRRLRHAVRGRDESWDPAAGARSLPAWVHLHANVVKARRAAIAFVLALGASVPLVLSNANRFRYTSTVLLALMGLSLYVLTGLLGRVSLGQFAFVAFGAVVGGRLQSLGYPWLTACLYATLAGGVVALVIGIPALRVRGAYLAVTTLAFSVATTSWLFRQRWLVQADDGVSALRVERPELFGVSAASELAYAWLCLACFVAVAAVLHRLRATAPGRAMIAVRDNEHAAMALAVPPAVVKLSAFALSGCVAAFGGYLYAGLLRDFGTQPERFFGPDNSLVLVATAVFGGVSSIAGIVAGTVWFRSLSEVLTPLLGGLLPTEIGALLSGGALLFAVLQFPGGVITALHRRRDRIARRLTGRELDEVTTSARAAGHERPVLPARARPGAEGVGPDATAPMLEAVGVHVRYGGIVALDDVSIAVRRGEVVALLGPNGAGKSTLFDVLSGVVVPDSGVVRFAGHDISRLPAERRAALGIGRTFQQARLFDRLTLLEVLEVAQERHDRGELLPSMLGLPPSRRSESAKRARAHEICSLLGLDTVVDRAVADLSTGTRRVAELACQVAMGAPVLLLDEPTAGVAQRDVEAFPQLLRELRDHLDATVVLVDHDIAMVRQVADRAYVLSAGRLIAQGPPAALTTDPAVVDAFLGNDTSTIERSGVAAVGART